MSEEARFGYLLVHFVEDAETHAENIYFSLSDGDDPTRWTRLNGGKPVLESLLGTKGVRDPYIIRTDEGFTILATDLRVWGRGVPDWDAFKRRGSRSLVLWDSPDLVHWSEPRLVEVAPPTAGMAWAPEAVRSPETGEFLVFWSSALYDEDDLEHMGESYSRILVARTRDFRRFSPAEVLVDMGQSVIDMTAVQVDGAVHRFLKEEPHGPGSRMVFHQVGPDFFGEDFRTVATRIGADRYDRIEAPLIFRDNREDVWYLFIDQYAQQPQGYIGLRSRDLASGAWEEIPADQFGMPANTKHGAVLPLLRGEWDRLGALRTAPAAEA